MGAWDRRRKAGLSALVVIASASAAGPRALAPASGGNWQVSHDARGGTAQSVCVADPVLFGQWEHRVGRCERVIVSDQGSKAIIDYTCDDGGFGHSEITLVTPRTLRVATQGISGGAPFNYVLHARRVGNCTPR